MVRQWKIAISLAIVGAITVPLVFRTYTARPRVDGFLPLTAEQKKEITAYLAKLDNCRKFETIPMDKLPREADHCFEQRGLLRNGRYYSYFSMPKYLVLNAAVAVAGFVSIFGLAMLLPALACRYWKWLNS